MKKSEESIADEIWQKFASLDVDCLNSSQKDAIKIEILHMTHNDLDHLGPLSRISEEKLLEKYKLYTEIRERLIQDTLPKERESKTGIATSFALTAHGSERVNSLPPKNAEFLLALFLDKQDQEAAIGCFAELYSKRVVRWGKSRARVWAWVQVGKTLAPVLKRVVLKVSGLVAAYEWLKHHLL